MNRPEGFDITTAVANTLEAQSSTMMDPFEVDDFDLPTMPTAFRQTSHSQGTLSRDELIEILSQALDLVNSDDFLDL